MWDLAARRMVLWLCYRISRQIKMTQPLLLDTLEIRNFRTFRHLRVDRLGRVNLVVGKVGKNPIDINARKQYTMRNDKPCLSEV